ncbi:MAG: AEC family transporter [Novosphingobium sp.]|uniref:AEC family transporter n=1 Tax=Novosphingobium sp. TaxID=1874826 RepID=UPI003B9D0404
MSAILGALFPVFGLIALGIWLGRSQVLGKDANEVLGRFVAVVTLPVLTFLAISGLNPGQLAQPVMGVVVIGGAWATYALHLVIERLCGERGPEGNIIALGAAYGNSGFVGLPICLALLGQDALGPAAVIMALNTAFVFAPGLLVQTLSAPDRHDTGDSLRAVCASLAKTPLMVACLAGIAAALVRISLPDPARVLLASIASATAPCALVAIGMFVAKPVERSVGAGMWRGVIGKLAISPLIAAGLLAILPPLDPIWTATALIMAAVPAASTVFIVAAPAGERARRFGGALIVWTTALSAFTIPLVLAALAVAGLAVGLP